MAGVSLVQKCRDFYNLFNYFFLNRAAGDRRPPEPVLHARDPQRPGIRRRRDERDRPAGRVRLPPLPGRPFRRQSRELSQRQYFS